MKERLEKEK